MMPIKAVQRRFTGNRDIRFIMVAVDDAYDTRTRCRRRSRACCASGAISAAASDDNFNIFDTKQISETLQGTTRILTAVMGAVAAVSLIVGGIGIMNIMLVSVTERTREIGIRLAIGAVASEVLMQFLVEAVVLACLGGLIGLRARAGRDLRPRAADPGAVPVRSADQPDRVQRLGADRHRLRLFPGAPRRRAQPDRRAAARIG